MKMDVVCIGDLIILGPQGSCVEVKGKPVNKKISTLPVDQDSLNDHWEKGQRREDCGSGLVK